MQSSAVSPTTITLWVHRRLLVVVLPPQPSTTALPEPSPQGAPAALSYPELHVQAARRCAPPGCGALRRGGHVALRAREEPRVRGGHRQGALGGASVHLLPIYTKTASFAHQWRQGLAQGEIESLKQTGPDL